MTTKQLPDGWQMVKFGDIARHISKRVEPSETELEIYVGLEHLDPDSLKIKRHGVPSDVAGQKLLVKKGQIIFGKRRAYQRKVAVADWDCICSAHAMVLEANSEIVIPEFLPFFMQSEVFMSRAVAISEGSLSPTIKWKTLSEQRFPLPSKKEQVSLVRLLSGIDGVLDKIDSSIDSQEKFIESVINELLLCPRKIEQDSVSVGQMCREQRVRVGPEQFAKESTYVGFEHLSAKNFWEINKSDLEGIVSQKLRFESGDILYGKIRPYLRKAALTAFEGVCSSDLVVLKPETSEMGLILASLFCSETFARNAMSSAKGTKMPRADWNVLSQLRIAKLSNDQIVQINSVLLECRDSFNNLKNKKSALIDIKMKLLRG
ncbi:restriction endonuclease subunit S [Xenorhabdus santafensis]|uniref:restriction endonuclease subunit S n=1 Tax=Xenorhabdus santafensis TaxID=2582833 RepID=UPI0029E82542|nr:restriction endonuclease subunit S [Xenorhabdus sp. 12]